MPDHDRPEHACTAAAAVAAYLSSAAHGRARTARALRLRGPGAWRELAVMTLCTVGGALALLLLA